MSKGADGEGDPIREEGAGQADSPKRETGRWCLFEVNYEGKILLNEKYESGSMKQQWTGKPVAGREEDPKKEL